MIKSTSYRFFTIVMAFVVLLSSTGFGLVEHSCMMRGESVAMAAMGKADSGCNMCKSATASDVHVSSPLQFKAKACCEESQRFQKLEVVSATASAVKVLKASPLSAALGEHRGSLPSFELVILSIPGWRSSRRAPLLPKNHGRTMLLFVQSFLI